LEETLMANKLASNKIDYQNLRYSGLRPRPVAASAVEDVMRLVVVVVGKRCRAVKFLETIEEGGQGNESVTDEGRSWVHIYLEGGVLVQIQMQQIDTKTTWLQCLTKNTIT
jgi:hypothetical protein